MRKLFFWIFACIAVIAAALPPAAFADTAGDAYQRGQIAWKNQDYETAFREYRTAGDLGHLDAQILLAINLSASPYREDFTESGNGGQKLRGRAIPVPWSPSATATGTGISTETLLTIRKR